MKYWWGLFVTNTRVTPSASSNQKSRPRDCISNLKKQDCDTLDQMFEFIKHFVELPENIMEYEPRALLERNIEKVLKECYE